MINYIKNFNSVRGLWISPLLFIIGLVLSFMWIGMDNMYNHANAIPPLSFKIQRAIVVILFTTSMVLFLFSLIHLSIKTLSNKALD